jgi:hypothetical protein
MPHHLLEGRSTGRSTIRIRVVQDGARVLSAPRKRCGESRAEALEDLGQDLRTEGRAALAHDTGGIDQKTRSSTMSSNRTPQTFIKRQREQRKHLEKSEKIARRRERSARKREAKRAQQDNEAAPAGGGGTPDSSA